MERRIALQAGVVDEYVDGTELRDHLPEHRGHLLFRRDVRLVRQRLHAEAAQFVHHGVGRVVAFDVVHHDIRAGLPQGNRHTATDAGIRTGDECLLPHERLVYRHVRRG